MRSSSCFSNCLFWLGGVSNTFAEDAAPIRAAVPGGRSRTDTQEEFLSQPHPGASWCLWLYILVQKQFLVLPGAEGLRPGPRASRPWSTGYRGLANGNRASGFLLRRQGYYCI